MDAIVVVAVAVVDATVVVVTVVGAGTVRRSPRPWGKLLPTGAEGRLVMKRKDEAEAELMTLVTELMELLELLLLLLVVLVNATL